MYILLKRSKVIINFIETYNEILKRKKLFKIENFDSFSFQSNNNINPFKIQCLNIQTSNSFNFQSNLKTENLDKKQLLNIQMFDLYHFQPNNHHIECNNKINLNINNENQLNNEKNIIDHAMVRNKSLKKIIKKKRRKRKKKETLSQTSYESYFSMIGTDILKISLMNNYK